MKKLTTRMNTEVTMKRTKRAAYRENLVNFSNSIMFLDIMLYQTNVITEKYNYFDYWKVIYKRASTMENKKTFLRKF